MSDPALLDDLEKHIIALSVISDGLMRAVHALREERPRATVPKPPDDPTRETQRFHQTPAEAETPQ